MKEATSLKKYCAEWQVPAETEWEVVEKRFATLPEAINLIKKLWSKDKHNGYRIYEQEYFINRWGQEENIGDFEIIMDCTEEDYLKVLGE